MMSDHFVRLCAALAAPLAAAVLTAAFPPLAQAAHPTWKVVFDRAEFVLSNAARPPDDTAGWKPVALPDEWRRTSPGISGQGWYRIRFDLEQAPRRMHAVFVEYRRSHQLDYFINGELVGSSRHVTATNTAGSLPGITVYVTIPPHLLHAGKNVLHVRMQATAAVAAIHGLGQVTFGEAREVRTRWLNGEFDS